MRRAGHPGCLSGADGVTNSFARSGVSELWSYGRPLVQRSDAAPVDELNAQPQEYGRSAQPRSRWRFLERSTMLKLGKEVGPSTSRMLSRPPAARLQWNNGGLVAWQRSFQTVCGSSKYVMLDMRCYLKSPISFVNRQSKQFPAIVFLRAILRIFEKIPSQAGIRRGVGFLLGSVGVGGRFFWRNPRR